MSPTACSDLSGLTDYVSAAMPTWSSPGVALAVLKGSEVLYQGVFGQRDVAAGLPLTADTRFPMASVTKSFAAMSLALLVDEGKLSWDTPLREYMPEFVLKDEYATQHITARDMLSHRTGLPRHDLSAWRLDLPPAEFVKRLRHLEPSASFREKFQYNNLMYYSVAHLVQTLSGVKWERFVHDRIFAPLGMTASNFAPEPPVAGMPLAQGYRVERHEDGTAKELVPTPLGLHTELSPGAAGALFSTLTDLSRWLEVHVNEGASGGVQLVTPANLKQMHLPHTVIPGGGVNEVLFGNSIFTYGLGWMIEPYKGHTLVHHGGNVEGHSLMIACVPAQQIGVVVMVNVAASFLRDALLYEALDRALGLPASDWSAKYHAIVDPLLAGQSKSKSTTAEERIANAPHSRPLEAYVGEFEAPGYPDISVRLVARPAGAPVDGAVEGTVTATVTGTAIGQLEACTVGSLPYTPVQHYHYDVFEWDLGDWEQRLKIRYLTNDVGELYAVSVPIEPAVANVTFTRKAPTLAPELLALISGTYQLPIEGMALTVSTAAGKVYVTPEGQAPSEVTVYKVDDGVVGLMLERVRLDLVREEGVFRRLRYLADGLTLEGERVQAPQA
ncbi:MAG: serine hydrolase [Trueperaceae bacterium]